jgi:hypothetical protein
MSLVGLRLFLLHSLSAVQITAPVEKRGNGNEGSNTAKNWPWRISGVCYSTYAENLKEIKQNYQLSRPQS